MNSDTLKRAHPCTTPSGPDRRQLSFEDVVAASHAIAPYVARTGFYENSFLSGLLGCRVLVKYENHQAIGSFKIRGTMTRLLALTPFERGRGIVTASQGNHGQGVAFGARLREIPATIVVPQQANADKVGAIERLGARVLRHGDDFESALAHAWDISLSECATFIHPGDDPEIIAGHGTVALEMLLDAPDLDTIIVPVGSGGLAAGVGVVVRALKPGCKVLGVQSAACPAYVASLAAGHPLEVPPFPTVADGIAVRRPPALAFDLVREHVDRVIAVGEREIQQAIVLLLEATHNLAEGAGAVALAGLVAEQAKFRGSTIGVVLSGGNITVPHLHHALNL